MCVCGWISERVQSVCCRPGKRGGRRRGGVEGVGQCLRVFENTRRSFVMAKRRRSGSDGMQEGMIDDI